MRQSREIPIEKSQEILATYSVLKFIDSNFVVLMHICIHTDEDIV